MAVEAGTPFRTPTSYPDLDLLHDVSDEVLTPHVPFFAAEATSGRRPWEQALNAWKYLLDDLGLTFRFLSYEQLEKGELTTDSYRVPILPVSLCLSGREIAAIDSFVRAGETVVADYGAGFFNEHGSPVPNAELLGLFGIVRSSQQTQVARNRAIMH